MTIAAAFRQLVESLSTLYDPGEAASIGRIVLEDAFGVRNVNREDQLASHQLHRLAEIEARLLDSEPVQYILGSADFYGLKFKVTPAVLIPRPETEELVHWILEDWPGNNGGAPGTALLDIGTGSGCIPVVVKKKRPRWSVAGLDVSVEALEIARKNGTLNGVDIDWIKLDILDRSGWESLGTFQIIVSNPPYIPENEALLMPENVRRYEPSRALFVKNEDPLLFYRTIAGFAQSHLARGGMLYFEVNEYHAEKVVDLLRRLAFGSVTLRRDLQGKARMVGARKKP